MQLSFGSLVCCIACTHPSSSFWNAHKVQSQFLDLCAPIAAAREGFRLPTMPTVCLTYWVLCHLASLLSVFLFLSPVPATFDNTTFGLTVLFFAVLTTTESHWENLPTKKEAKHRTRVDDPLNVSTCLGASSQPKTAKATSSCQYPYP